MATMSSHRSRPAVFIDKDGTLVENVPWNVDPERLRLLPGAAQALATLASHGLALVVVTNQSGLAEGRFSAAQFAGLCDALRQRLAVHGVSLTDVLHCPHAPAPDGRPACPCRKPRPGLLLRAARLHGLALARSWMVGDILDDVEAGRRAGCRTLLLDTGGETAWRRSRWRWPHHTAADWTQAARCMVGPPGPPPRDARPQGRPAPS